MTTSDQQIQAFGTAFRRIRLNRGLAFGVIIVAALLAFEVFNYSTTDFALGDLLGDLRFVTLRWSTILAIAFCGIDFAGIARLFTPEEGKNEAHEVWYLFGAWLLAATMNAMLTWWGVSLAILNHNTLGNTVIPRETLVRAVPIFVAVLVWLIRVLIIGSFSVAGDKLFSEANQRVRVESRPASRVIASPPPARSLGNANQAPLPRMSTAPINNAYHPAPKTVEAAEGGHARQELTYTSVLSAAPGPANARVINNSPARSGMQKNR